MCENMRTIFQENLLATNVEQQGTPLKGRTARHGIVWPRYSQPVYNTCMVVKEYEGLGLDHNKTTEFLFLGIKEFWARLRLILSRAAGRGFK